MKWEITYTQAEGGMVEEIEADRMTTQGPFLAFVEVGTVKNAEGEVALNTVALINMGGLLTVKPAAKSVVA